MDSLPWVAHPKGRRRLRSGVAKMLKHFVEPPRGFSSLLFIPQNKKNRPKGGFIILAEREGFEPPEPSRAQRFSRPPQSSTLPPLRD